MVVSAIPRPAAGLRRAVTRAAAILSAFVIAACQPMDGSQGASGPATGSLINPDEPVRVALLAPGGSGSADLEWLSRSLKNAARMAAADAQGASIDLRIYDTGTSTAQAVAQANAAVDAGAQIIVGPLFAEGANAVGTAMRPRNVNVLSFSNNAEIAGGNVFILGNSFANVANRLVGYGVRQGKRNIYVVAEDDIAGQLGGRAIETAIARNGARLAGRSNHAVSVTGIDAATPQIVAAAQSGRVDAVFMTANNQAVLPYLTEKLAAAGVRSPVTQMMGLTRWDQPANRIGMPQLQEGWFAIPDQGLKAQFDARYRSVYGEQPHELASLAYDGVAAIASLVRSGNRNALTTTGLTQAAGFSGVGGVFRLRPDGTSERALAVATLRGNRLVILDPAPRGFGGGFGF
ncbi:penicillin-binding protein activator [Paracoccus sediminis]|uniref:Amino acid/amide ABC transporter substrate-binding protein, HAAT family n=1 Tax=Paracoccus sediminis TaxID=1214787 RepID=A0A238XBG0_9RHOB|nr:penicillin-binding protein activator [Paracoccus sediminis]TBN49622.1 penicillin-binding protein activator [Paracoccus sediminis]SNR56395.1 amino acid/amide ABC transporter substrate-binding protein, HAAT family [Paracoccus sediminis]